MFLGHELTPRAWLQPSHPNPHRFPLPPQGLRQGFPGRRGFGGRPGTAPENLHPTKPFAARQPQPKQGCATIKTVTFTGHNPNNFPTRVGMNRVPNSGGVNTFPIFPTTVGMTQASAPVAIVPHASGDEPVA